MPEEGKSQMNKELKPSRNFIGYSFIKRSKNGKIIKELWQDDGIPDKKGNTWKRIMSFKEPDYIRPRWVDSLEEYLAIPEEERKNVHIKSKPTHSDPYIDPKSGEIHIRCTDEYDHMYTIRLDNPYNLDAKQAKEVLDDLTKDCKKE